MFWLKEAVPVWEPRVEVAVPPPTRFELVPQANPDWMALAPPVERMEPFNVAVVEETPVAAFVETDALVEGVTEFDWLLEALVPTILVAVTVKVYG